MEKLVSNKKDIKFVPESYILPVDSRPGNTEVSVFEKIPIIDLKEEPSKLIQQIIDACTVYGFFQLINHGVEENLLQDVLDVTKEFFELPAEDKAYLYSDDPRKNCKLYTSIDYLDEKIHYWRDALRHDANPLEEHTKFWPKKPARYRELVGRFAVEVRKLSLYILDLIGKGLGLEPGYFRDGIELTASQSMGMNHYPACPDPSLTLGLPKHADLNLITFVLQEMEGLQVLKDGQWLTVEAVPNAFVVNLGHSLQFISNGKLKSVEHRVVTHQTLPRTTVGSFIFPSLSCQIEPAKALIKDDSPPIYKPFIFKDFLVTYVRDTHQRKPPLERYMF